MRSLVAAIAFLIVMTAHAADSVNIVAFNAENLFDTVDDAGNPHDDTYIPKSAKDANQPAHDNACEARYSNSFYRKQCKELDWSESVYDTKLKRYADVLKAMPQMPAVVVIPETENKRVLDDLVHRHLSETEYHVVQLDTSDKPESRGIDVGLLTRLPIVGTPIAHKVDFGTDEQTCGKTRDILQVDLELPDNETLTVFGVHFPSGRSPVRCRYRALKTLNDLSANLQKGSLSIAAGDFNINCNETTTEAFDRLLFRGNWYISPVATAGCSTPGSSKFVDRLLHNWNTWSFLDLIIVSKELSPSQPSTKNWFADLGSFQTLAVHSEQITVDAEDKGYIEPRRFDPETGRGVSDHWPVGMRLLPRRSSP